MIQYTPELKRKFEKTTKGQVYLFIIIANDLALQNKYKYQATDCGIKEASQFFDYKISALTDWQKGWYWKNDFAGFETILKLAKRAKKYIVKQEYNHFVADLLDEVMKSKVKNFSELLDQKQNAFESMIPSTTKEVKLEEGLTGKDFVKQKQREIFFEELNQLESLLA